MILLERLEKIKGKREFFRTQKRIMNMKTSEKRLPSSLKTDK
jgi:hypothetical protein